VTARQKNRHGRRSKVKISSSPGCSLRIEDDECFNILFSVRNCTRIIISSVKCVATLKRILRVLSVFTRGITIVFTSYVLCTFGTTARLRFIFGNTKKMPFLCTLFVKKIFRKCPQVLELYSFVMFSVYVILYCHVRVSKLKNKNDVCSDVVLDDRECIYAFSVVCILSSF